MGKEVLNTAFRCKTVDNVPWVPFVGCHGGSLINVDAEEYLKSGKLIYEGISTAIENYKPDGIPVIFDLQLEAEALGCKLQWNKKTPPAVINHPLAEGVKIDNLKIPGPESGRIPAVLEAAGNLTRSFPDTGFYGLVTGPFTLCLHLLGTDIFTLMLEDPGKMSAFMEFSTSVAEKMAGYYMNAGCDFIALVDPMTSQIDTDSFRSFVSPYATRFFNYIREKGKLSSFFVCGHAQQNIEAMCCCQPDNISIDENIPLEYVRDIAGKKKLSFGGNLKLTMVLLHGTEDEVLREAQECIDVGGHTGFILSPGCDLPYDTPPRNLKAITTLIKDTYQQEIVRAIRKKAADTERLNMKDYGMADKVIIDIITLDSESCAPCQYMVEAVKRVAHYFEGILEWREHPIKKIEGISFMSSLMVKNIPTICIDGRISFVSKIPPQQELITAIQKRINEKLKLRIRSKKGELILVGKDEEEIKEIKLKISTAIEESGKDILLKVSTDPDLKTSFGILKTPAVVLAQYKLKSEGDSPSMDVIKEWIKSI